MARTCEFCRYWKRGRCNHPRHENSDIDSPCGRFRYQNRYEGEEPKAVLTAAPPTHLACHGCGKKKPRGSFLDAHTTLHPLC